jgi:hypothetical protein
MTRSGRKPREKLVDAGKLQSGKDFFYAALIFQHSFEGPNLILAHALAATAAAKGEASGRWLTASSFDRYLWSLKQPQVFGTQFSQMGGELVDGAVRPHRIVRRRSRALVRGPAKSPGTDFGGCPQRPYFEFHGNSGLPLR